MSADSNRTTIPTSEQAAKGRGWVVVDAANRSVGRVASEVAAILRGKNKVTFTPHVDSGDFVVVINCAKLQLTGKKAEQKIYYDYSGYVGGLKGTVAGKLMEKDPCNVMERAVKGMIPHGPLGYRLMKKLKTFAGAEHKHASQVSKGSGKKSAQKEAAAS